MGNCPPPLVEIGLTDLPNTGWAITQSTHPPVTPLKNVCANHLICRTSLFTFWAEYEVLKSLVFYNSQLLSKLNTVCISSVNNRLSYKYVHNCQQFPGLRTNSGNNLTVISNFNNVGILNHVRKNMYLHRTFII